MTDLPRGVRNNNPLNIRSGDAWQGMTDHQDDDAFVHFKSPEWGFRAAFRLYRSYRNYRISTIRGVIERWAPPNENDTPAYIRSVCALAGIDADTLIDLTGWRDVSRLAIAQTHVEQGDFDAYFTDEQVRVGALWAGVTGVPQA